MSASLLGFLVRCTVIVAASTVLLLALMEAGTAGESLGACASNANHYAQVNWLQLAVRPLAAFASFCDY
jgi:hypothetical protein